MSLLRYLPGEIAKAKRRQVEILSVEGLERIFCRDIKNGKTRYFSAQDLQSPDSGTQEKESVEDSLILGDKERAEVARRLEVLRPIVSCPKGKRYQVVAEQVRVHKVSKTTIYRWLKLFEKSENKASSLAKGKMANRKSRLSRAVLKVINQTIAEHFETSQKPIFARTMEQIRLLCWEKKLSPPSEKTVRRYISLRNQREQTKKRHGEKRAREKHDLLQGETPYAQHILDVVQMDHSLMDVMIVDSTRRHTIGRPWLTLAIDAYSRMVTGFYISLENPSQFLVGMCLANSMLSKDIWLESMELEARNWPVWGKIERLLVDNAREFRSEGLADLCEEYGTDLEFRGVNMPEHGGIVERFFGTLEQQVHTLPGSTFSNPKERGDYLSEERAVMTLDEFESFVADWIVSHYHITPHEGLGGRKPIEVWFEDIKGTGKNPGRGVPAKLDGDRESILVNAMPSDTRVVTRQGIVWDYVHYRHPQFSRLLGEKITVKRDPRNIKFVWFYEESTRKWLRAGCRDVSFAAVNLWEFRAVQGALRESGSRIDEATVFGGVRRRRELVEVASDERRKAKGQHKKALRAQETGRRFASDDKPLLRSSPNSRSRKGLTVIRGGAGESLEESGSRVSESFFTAPKRTFKVRED